MESLATTTMHNEPYLLTMHGPQCLVVKRLSVSDLVWQASLIVIAQCMGCWGNILCGILQAFV